MLTYIGVPQRAVLEVSRNFSKKEDHFKPRVLITCHEFLECSWDSAREIEARKKKKMFIR